MTSVLRMALPLLALLAACGGPTLAPTPVAERDLTVAGVSYRDDTATIRRALGDPDSVSHANWYYPGLTLFVEQGHVDQILLLTPSHSTARGLRVGDKVGEVRHRYGHTCMQATYAYCWSPAEAPNERGVVVRTRRGRVYEIRVGDVFDLE